MLEDPDSWLTELRREVLDILRAARGPMTGVEIMAASHLATDRAAISIELSFLRSVRAVTPVKLLSGKKEVTGYVITGRKVPAGQFIETSRTKRWPAAPSSMGPRQSVKASPTPVSTSSQHSSIAAWPRRPAQISQRAESAAQAKPRGTMEAMTSLIESRLAKSSVDKQVCHTKVMALAKTQEEISLVEAAILAMLRANRIGMAHGIYGGERMKTYWLLTSSPPE